MLTRQQRAHMAACCMNYAREVAEAEGEGGDFDDGERYLRDDAADWELQDEYDKLPESAK